MSHSSEAKRFFRTLAARLGPDLLAQVCGALIDSPEPQPLRLRRYRKKDFKEVLRCGDTKWAELRAQGLIPEGVAISSHVELWTEAQVLETVALLADREVQRKEALRKEAELTAAAEGIPAPRLLRSKPAPDAKGGSAMPVPVQRGRRLSSPHRVGHRHDE
jgi:hypothetical protein